MQEGEDYMMKEKKPQILMIDDAPEYLDTLNDILEEKYVLYVAVNGDQGLTILKNNPDIDLVLLDVVMPIMSGYELCETIKSIEKLKDIPVIFLTSKSDVEDIEKGFGLGAVDYIMKPFRAAELLARVQTHINLKKAREEITLLLNDTFIGINKVFIDMMSITSPLLFSRASRLSHYVTFMLNELDLREKWKFQMGALYSQLGLVFLEESIITKICMNNDLNEIENQKKEESEKLGIKLLKSVPKLNEVIPILPSKKMDSLYGKDIDSFHYNKIGKAVLELILTFDNLTLNGLGKNDALIELAKMKCYNTSLIQVLSKCIKEIELKTSSVVVEVSQISSGMILDDDIYNKKDILVLSKGTEVSQGLKNKIRNMAKENQLKEERVKVLTLL